MICIVGGRGNGKTASLLKLSHDSGIPIVVSNYQRLQQLEHQAQQMGLKIPRPEIVFHNVPKRGTSRRAVLADEAQDILQSVIGCDVEIVTIDASAYGFYSAPKSLRALLRWWWSLGEERKW